jgi:predicted ATPase with chaperone activity
MNFIALVTAISKNVILESVTVPLEEAKIVAAVEALQVKYPKAEITRWD